MINIIEFIKSFKNFLLYLLLLSVFELYFKNGSVFALFITTLLLVVINRDLFLKKDKDFKKNIKKYLIIIIKYWLIGSTLMIISNYIINHLTDSMAVAESLNRKQLNDSLLSSLITMILLGPICEEIIFRGSFKKAIKNKYIFCLFTSLFFGLLHVTFNSDIIYIIPYAFLGYFLAIAYYETDNIYTSIIMHMWHNLIVIILFLIGVSI